MHWSHLCLQLAHLHHQVHPLLRPLLLRLSTALCKHELPFWALQVLLLLLLLLLLRGLLLHGLRLVLDLLLQLFHLRTHAPHLVGDMHSMQRLPALHAAGARPVACMMRNYAMHSHALA